MNAPSSTWRKCCLPKMLPLNTRSRVKCIDEMRSDTLEHFVFKSPHAH